jgi:hypothetical protein
MQKHSSRDFISHEDHVFPFLLVKCFWSGFVCDLWIVCVLNFTQEIIVNLCVFPKIQYVLNILQQVCQTHGPWAT